LTRINTDFFRPAECTRQIPFLKTRFYAEFVSSTADFVGLQINLHWPKEGEQKKVKVLLVFLSETDYNSGFKKIGD
jgi:hypothetical protein